MSSNMLLKTGPKKSETKQQIVQKAAEFFRESGYYGVTVEEIARSLRISKTNIYYYWPEKQDLLFEIHRSAHESLLEGLKAIANNGQPAEVRLRQAIANHIGFACSERSPTTGALQQEHALKNRYKRALIRLRDQYDKLLRQIIVDGIREGVFCKNDSKLIGFVIVGMANYTQHWYSSKGSMPKEEIIQKLTDITMTGILRHEIRREALQTTQTDKAPVFVELGSSNHKLL